MTLCSVLLPTRGRPLKLVQALSSLKSTAYHWDDIEVFLRVDDDDTLTQSFLPHLHQLGNRFTVVQGERRGYAGLHEMLNELAFMAKGKWLFPYTDDCKVLTPGWDEMLTRQPEKVLAVGNFDAWNIFNFDCLFFRRQVYEVLGRVSAIPAFDTHLSTVLFAVSGISIIPVSIAHNYESDQTHREGDTVRAIGDQVYHSPDLLRERLKDIEKLIKWKETLCT